MFSIRGSPGNIHKYNLSQCFIIEFICRRQANKIIVSVVVLSDLSKTFLVTKSTNCIRLRFPAIETPASTSSNLHERSLSQFFILEPICRRQANKIIVVVLSDLSETFLVCEIFHTVKTPQRIPALPWPEQIC